MTVHKLMDVLPGREQSMDFVSICVNNGNIIELRLTEADETNTSGDKFHSVFSEFEWKFSDHLKRVFIRKSFIKVKNNNFKS